MGQLVPDVAHGIHKCNAGLQHAGKYRRQSAAPFRSGSAHALDQASVSILLSNVRNPIYSVPSAASEGAFTQVAVAAACLLLLYVSVYILHFSSVGHMRRISAPPAQMMCAPSPLPLFLAFLCVCAAVPIGAICALCRSSIVWAGIRYGIKDGGVCSVVRPCASPPALLYLTLGRCEATAAAGHLARRCGKASSGMRLF